MIGHKNLNKEQQAAITHGEGPLLIIAGAGTGKTTVVTERIKHLILDKYIDPKNILALTFTEKAAKEMEERIDIALPYGYTQMWIATFHAFCDRVLRDEAIHIGLNPGYKLATETEMVLFLRKNLFKLELEYFRPLGNPNKFLQGLLQHFNRLKDEDISPEEYLVYAKDRCNTPNQPPEEEEENSKILELAKAYKTLEDLKIKEGIMDFGDLITYTLKLLRTRKHILKAYQDKFRYILIDEFQDTNYAQNQLALLLAGTRKNLTVVGDDDQAIYRWRGAAISNMIQFRKHFPETKIITLTKNYRSTASVLDTSYKLIQHNNPDRLEVKEHIDKRLEAMRDIQGDLVEVVLAQRGDSEADAIVEKIEALIKKKKYAYKDFAILVRANDHAQPFIRALERSRIPFQFLGPGQLFHQEEIKDLIAYLKILYDFSDSASLYRVLTMSTWKITATEIAVLLHGAKTKNQTLFETLSDLPELSLSDGAKEKLTRIVALIRSHLEKVSKETAGQILYDFLKESGLLEEFITINSAQEELRVQNVAKFFDRLKAYESETNDASVFAVVEWIDLSMQMGESPLAATGDWSENDAVNILTIHSSKGLEFPVVFITNLVTLRFPSRERREQIPLPQDIIKEVLPEGDYHLQEERRLFYVAMTRARDQLFLTAANFYGDGKRERKLSPFLLESLGDEKVEEAKNHKYTQKSQLSLLDMFPSQKEFTELSEIIPHELTYISYSQIQTFDTCPLHYKLKYILKIPSPQSAAQIFGTSLHAALKDFYMRAIDRQKPTVDDIESILTQHWEKEGYEGKEHERQAFAKGLAILKKYILNNYDPHILPIALEIPFQIPLTKTLHIGGRIDRIDRLDEETLEIIDYKTGKNMPDEKELLKNFQLTLYGLAASEIRDPILHRKPENLKLSLYYLEQGAKLTTMRTAEQLEKAKQQILEKVEEITHSDFACSGGMACENCEYKMLCKTS